MNNDDNLPIDHKENISVNNSGNTSFEDVMKKYSSRRDVLAGGMALAASSFFITTSDAEARGYHKDFDSERRKHYRRPRKLIDFSPVPNSVGKSDNREPTISEDYQFDVLIPWGTPLEPGLAPEFKGDPNTRPTSKQASRQIGIGHDGMWFFASRWNRNKGMLAINHEYGTNSHVLGKSTPESLEDVRLSQAVHGVSIVALERKGRGYNRGNWEVVASRNSRRITVNCCKTRTVISLLEHLTTAVQVLHLGVPT